MSEDRTPYVASGRPDMSDGADRTGWNEPRPAEIPRPTFWPMVMGLGITVAAWGLLLDTIVVWAGLVVFAIALGGWIGDLLHE